MKPTSIDSEVSEEAFLLHKQILLAAEENVGIPGAGRNSLTFPFSINNHKLNI